MKTKIKYISASLLLHLTVICIAFAVSRSFINEPKAITIDLTLTSAPGSGSPGEKRKMDRKDRDSHETSVQKKQGNTHPIPLIKKIKEDHIQKDIKTVPVMAKKPDENIIFPKSQPTQKKEISSLTSKEPVAANSTSDTIDNTLNSGGNSASSGTNSGTGNGSGGGGSGSGGDALGNGTGASIGQLKNMYFREQFEYIKTMIQKNLTYPAKAKRMGWSGRVTVSFIIMENGNVAGMKIESSSGYDLLDKNVLNTIKTVQPFPKPPVRAEIKIPITYNLFD